MRVAEIARLTGTTVRTVRYYHQLGLLPVPEERGGWRDYDLSHVARLSRIRWFVQAGVPLKSIAQILDQNAGTSVQDRSTGTSVQNRNAGASVEDQNPGTSVQDRSTGTSVQNRSAVTSARESSDSTPDSAGSTVLADLTGALDAVEEHLAEVLRQRDMLVSLLERAREGMTLSPMPPRMVAFFDRLEAAAPDEWTRAAIRRERDAVDVACYRGQMPAEAELLFPEADDAEDASVLAAYGQNTAEFTDDEATAHAAANIARFERVLGPERCRTLARGVDRTAIRTLFRLWATMDAADARIVAAMERLLDEAIERWRNQ
ncbi:MerR family transcriptional regulator [Actinobaculum sp. 352]|uniref:MerR family transcriptional regulator n=1 Tax=Actinobaculum sp. 352 TaxID=2490946 RepID=UPI000F7E908A|nr:MerR family transcriptional regulator [Actinobaculum sp. 352]RTE50369.1 MerR family transcriptional regulator [Actinobaculum sp. 352]